MYAQRFAATLTISFCFGVLAGCSGSNSTASAAPSTPTQKVVAPTASFASSPASPVAGQTVTFNDTSSGSPTTWAWNFGDGTTSSVENPTHSFSASGAYSVTLKATNSAGSGSTTQVLTVAAAASAAPVASFTLSPAAPTTGQSIAFTDTSTGKPTSWAWTFGDGTSSTTENPSHTFAAAGTYTIALTATNPGGSTSASQTITIAESTAAAAPAAAFQFSPVQPVTGQSVSFSDTSDASPTAWSWNFGDGTTSTSQNPAHSYAAAGTFTVTLKATNSQGSSTTTQQITTIAPSSSAIFDGSIVLGTPGTSTIKANIFTPDQSGTVSISYGLQSGNYSQQTASSPIQSALPVVLTLTGLAQNTQYYYRLNFQATGQSVPTPTSEYSFHTVRPPGSSFVFDIQGDSHPERVNTEFYAPLYVQTLQAAAADKPDFYMTLGDDFSVDTLDPTTIDNAEVVGRYTLQRQWFGLIANSAPLFLTNGNHEQAARYLLNGTPNSIAVWAQNARNSLYSEPATDDFYSGNTEQIPFVGLLRNYYAWTWGDALFVVIDPYWESPICVDEPFGGGAKRSNIWNVTHGDEQYQWLTQVLQNSTAKHKFVFAHHVMGTGRGGIETVPYYEWGGENANGTFGFAANRPTWPDTIHQLFVNTGVTIFFQGHDHIWVHQQLNGVTYQTLSEPGDPNYALNNSDAYLTGDKFPNTGYTRVTVSPTSVKVEYVREWLPADQTATQQSGSVAFSYTIP